MLLQPPSLPKENKTLINFIRDDIKVILPEWNVVWLYMFWSRGYQYSIFLNPNDDTSDVFG